jgi:hypothetical protein
MVEGSAPDVDGAADLRQALPVALPTDLFVD